jgi:hypothetical protein
MAIVYHIAKTYQSAHLKSINSAECSECGCMHFYATPVFFHVPTLSHFFLFIYIHICPFTMITY